MCDRPANGFSASGSSSAGGANRVIARSGLLLLALAEFEPGLSVGCCSGALLWRHAIDSHFVATISEQSH
jgi:hypothetical protein